MQTTQQEQPNYRYWKETIRENGIEFEITKNPTPQEEILPTDSDSLNSLKKYGQNANRDGQITKRDGTNTVQERKRDGTFGKSNKYKDGLDRIKRNEKLCKFLLSDDNIEMVFGYKSLSELPTQISENSVQILKDRGFVQDDGNELTQYFVSNLITELKINDRVPKPLVFFYCFVSAVVPTLLMYFWFFSGEQIKRFQKQDFDLFSNQEQNEFVLEENENQNQNQKVDTSFVSKLIKIEENKNKIQLTEWRKDLIKSDCIKQNCFAKDDMIKQINQRISEIKNK